MKLFLLNIAIKSTLNRKWSISLVIFSIVISTMLLLGVEKIRDDIKSNFTSSVSGIDLIVGARGSSTQLVLYSIFHIGRATNNINEKTIKYITEHENVDYVVPISLGDSYKKFPVVATEKIYFEKMKNLTFKNGTFFDNDFEVVIGSEIAKKIKLNFNDTIKISHGNSDQEHKENFKVKGILNTTGTPADTSIFITLNAMDIIHSGFIPQKRTITSLLVKLKERRKIFSMQREFNNYKKEPLTAILPIVSIEELWNILNIGENALIFISKLVMFSSLLGLCAIILASLNERKKEISILRMFGANFIDICSLVLFESLLVMLCGMLLGIILLYGVNYFLSSFVLLKYGIRISNDFFNFILISKIFASGIIISIIPIIKAYIISLKNS